MFSLQGKPGCPLGVVLIWGYRMKTKRLKMRVRKIQDQAAAKHHGHYSRTIVKKIWERDILGGGSREKRNEAPGQRSLFGSEEQGSTTPPWVSQRGVVMIDHNNES